MKCQTQLTTNNQEKKYVNKFVKYRFLNHMWIKFVTQKNNNNALLRLILVTHTHTLITLTVAKPPKNTDRERQTLFLTFPLSFPLFTKYASYAAFSSKCRLLNKDFLIKKKY